MNDRAVHKFIAKYGKFDIIIDDSDHSHPTFTNNIKNFKIIIVDNAGNISLEKKIKEKYKIYKYFLNKKNYGFSKLHKS